MKTLIVFEWKKIIQRKLNLVAMIVGYVLIGICLFCYISQQSFYDETTDTYITGVKAYHENRIKNESMTDYLTEEYVSDIIAQIQYENMDLESDEGYTEVIRPIGSLFYLLGEHYQSCQEFGKLNCLNEMKISKGAKFYERRMEKIGEILNMDYSFGNYSGEEKAFWIKKALKVKMPFAWGDSENMYTVWMIIQISFYLLFVIMICVSPLFASEYESGAVALLLTTKYGKNKLITAKIITAIIFSLVYLIVGIGTAVGVFGIIVGIWGTDLPVQLMNTIIPYNWSIGQACVISFLLVLLVALAIVLFTAMLSARTKGSMITLVIDFLILIGPVFLPMSKEWGLWNDINYLFPVRAISLENVISVFNSYQIGTIVISYLGMIIIVYTIVAIFSLCGIKNGFAKHQVSN